MGARLTAGICIRRSPALAARSSQAGRAAARPRGLRAGARVAPHMRLNCTLLSADAVARGICHGASWGSLDVDFHKVIYALDGRPRLQEMIDGLLRRVDRYWLIRGLMLRHRATFDREHRMLLAAVRERDAARAGWVLETHLAGAASLLAEAVENGGAATGR